MKWEKWRDLVFYTKGGIHEQMEDVTYQDAEENFVTSEGGSQVIKWRKMKWVGHVTRMEGGERCLQGFGWEVRMEQTIGKT
jgi:hypothetical protein